MKKPPLKSSRPYHVNYLEGFWLAYARDTIKKSQRLLSTKPSLFKGRFSLLPAPKVRIEWILIAFLLAVVLSGARARIIPETSRLDRPKLIKQLPQTALQPTQTPLQPVPVPEPVPAPQPVYTAPVVSTVIGCGSDPYMAQIYTHESGCSTTNTNSIGCVGLGQACPGSKLYAVCPTLDWNCENNFFVGYAIARYGSPAQAWAVWQSQRWW